MQKNLELSKKVTQNLVHKSLENITHFLNAFSKNKAQYDLTVLCHLTVFSNHCTGPPELDGGYGAAATASHVLN